VIGESMVAVVLAEAFLEKFGADNMTDIRASYGSYTTRLRAAGTAARHPERDPEARS
jgi:chorismate synthase